MNRALALVGPRCAGKSSVAVWLGRELDLPVVDLDDRAAEFARRAGFSVESAGEALELCGRALFRTLEAAALRSVLEPGCPLVLATGGGVVERDENRAWLARAAEVVWLDARPETLSARMSADPTLRPALLPGGDPISELTEMARFRRPLHRAVAAHRIETDELDPEAVGRRVLDR